VASGTGTSGWGSLFWAAFMRSKNPMALLDRERVLVALNQALTEAYGFDEHDALGRRGDIFLTPGDWKRADADWRDVLARRRNLHVREIVRADGKHVRVQAATHPTEVGGRLLVLFVVLDEQLKPLRAGERGARAATSLTPRELEIVSYVAMGRRAWEVAEELVIAPTTVETHLRNAMAKVGARSQAQLVAIALTQGLLDPQMVNPEIPG